MNYKTDRTLIALMKHLTKSGNSNMLHLFGNGGVVQGTSNLIWNDGGVPERYQGKSTWAHAWSDIIIAASEVLKETENEVEF